MLKDNLRPSIRSKRRGLLTTGVILQHDNARPHTTSAKGFANALNLGLRLQPSMTFTLRFFYIHHTHQTSPEWLPHVWTTQRGNGRKEISVQWRGIPGSARVAAHMTFFFSEESVDFLHTGGSVLNVMETVEKCYTCVLCLFNKLN